MDGWMDGCMDVCMCGCMYGWIYGWMDGCVDVWMYVCMDGWMDDIALRVCIYVRVVLRLLLHCMNTHKSVARGGIC